MIFFFLQNHIQIHLSYSAYDGCKNLDEEVSFHVEDL